MTAWVRQIQVAFYKTSHIHHTMRNTGQEPLVGLAFKV